MKFQKAIGYCGPASIQNALRCFGVKVSQEKVFALLEIPENERGEGIDEKDIMFALMSLGFSPVRFESENKKSAINLLREYVQQSPAILCTMDEQHWVVAIGTIGERIIVIDPNKTVRNQIESGILVMSPRELLNTWYCKRTGKCEGIIVVSPEKPR